MLCLFSVAPYLPPFPSPLHSFIQSILPCYALLEAGFPQNNGEVTQNRLRERGKNDCWGFSWSKTKPQHVGWQFLLTFFNKAIFIGIDLTVSNPESDWEWAATLLGFDFEATYFVPWIWSELHDTAPPGSWRPGGMSVKWWQQYAAVMANSALSLLGLKRHILERDELLRRKEWMSATWGVYVEMIWFLH